MVPERKSRAVAAASLLTLGMLAASPAPAAIITQLASEADFVSSEVIVDSFDAPLGSATEYSFDPTAFQITSNEGQLARTGNTFLGDSTKPLAVTLAVETYEVGAYMGNDDDNPFRFGSVFFGQVDFFLDAYDRASNLLGTVQVAGTGNDLIDQFVGLRSSVPLGSVVFRNTSEYFNPGLALDDFAIGFERGGSTPVREPSVLPLLLAGLGLAAWFARRSAPPRAARGT